MAKFDVDPALVKKLAALLEETGGMAVTLMKQLGSDRTSLQHAAAGAVEETLATDEPLELEIRYSELAEAVLRHAFYAARSAGDRQVGTDHLLLGLLLLAAGRSTTKLHLQQILTDGNGVLLVDQELLDGTSLGSVDSDIDL